MATTLTTIDVSQYQDPNGLPWESLITQGLKSIIIRLSHGYTADPRAKAFMVKAKAYSLVVHGYHCYEGDLEEVSFAVRNAEQLGLANGAHFFLDLEPNVTGDWDKILYTFAPEFLRAGWKPGIYCSDIPYKSKLDDEKISADKITRWIAAYSYEPKNYDIWQYSSSNGTLDLDYDKDGILSLKYDDVKHKPDKKESDDNDFPPIDPGKPTGDSYVGWAKDSRLGGGQTIGYSPNGKDFYAALWPGGFVFRQVDADHMWPYLKNKIAKAMSIKWDDIQNKPTVVTSEELNQRFKELNIPAPVDLSNYVTRSELTNYAKISDLPVIPTDLIHSSDLEIVKNDVSKAQNTAGNALSQAQANVKELATKADRSELPDLTPYALKTEIPSLDGYAKLTDIPSVTDFIKRAELADYAKKSDIPTSMSWDSITGKPDVATQEDLQKIQLTPGPPGKDGANGKDGVSPNIGSNGHWWVGNVDTGVNTQGQQGPPGQSGTDGLNGKDGKSAYEIAKDNGFTGNEQEWLDSLKGAPGKSSIITIDVSDISSVKKPSDYKQPITKEVTELTALGIDLKKYDESFQSGFIGLVTTEIVDMFNIHYAVQTVRTLGAYYPTMFIRNGTGDSWYPFTLVTTFGN